MTRKEAHDALASLSRRPRQRMTLLKLQQSPIDVWPAITAAAASLSGWLLECETSHDVRMAAKHFHTCRRAGCFTLKQLGDETAELLHEVEDWEKHILEVMG